MICGLRIREGVWSNDQQVLQIDSREFFQSIYVNEEETRQCYRVKGRFTAVLVSQLETLHRPVSSIEVRNALFDMSHLKTPRPDGFNAHFYQRNWEVVGDSVCRMIQETFSSCEVSRELNTTLICLVPKVTRPECFRQAVHICKPMQCLLQAHHQGNCWKFKLHPPNSNPPLTN